MNHCPLCNDPIDSDQWNVCIPCQDDLAQAEEDRKLHEFMSANPGYLDGAVEDDSDHQYRPSL